ncbi:hypothetical protein BDW75DRAFT_213789, partial [Aspergillus navahoensis]
MLTSNLSLPWLSRLLLAWTSPRGQPPRVNGTYSIRSTEYGVVSAPLVDWQYPGGGVQWLFRCSSGFVRRHLTNRDI